jgi:hypothetical protein
MLLIPSLLCFSHSIATQDDVDRLWDSVEKAICVMAEESKNEQDAPPL